MLAVGTFCMAAVAIVASPTCPDGMTSLDTFEWKAEVSVTVCSPNPHPFQLVHWRISIKMELASGN